MNTDGITDAWTQSMFFVGTDAATSTSTYTIDLAAGNTAIMNHPFVIHDSSGTRVYCGMVEGRQHTGALHIAPYASFVATLAPLTGFTHAGAVSLYTSGLTTLSLMIEVDSTLACTGNDCGAHVHAGTACTDATSQGGHQLNVDGLTDMWTQSMTFVSTDAASGKSTYKIDVTGGNTAILAKPFVIHNAAGVRVMCGVIGAAVSDTRKYTGDLAAIGGAATVIGSVGIYTRGASSLSLVVTLPFSSACTGNDCGAHVHAGTGCTDASTQGGHLLNTDGITDAWTQSMLFIGHDLATSVSTYTIDIAAGNTAVRGKPFVVHNSAGVRVYCGMLEARQYAGAVALAPVAPTPPPSLAPTSEIGDSLSVAGADDSMAVMAIIYIVGGSVFAVLLLVLVAVVVIVLVVSRKRDKKRDLASFESDQIGKPIATDHDDMKASPSSRLSNSGIAMANMTSTFYKGGKGAVESLGPGGSAFDDEGKELPAGWRRHYAERLKLSYFTDAKVRERTSACPRAETRSHPHTHALTPLLSLTL